MKLKSLFNMITKMPFLFLLTAAIFLGDAVYDGILPWPSPFQIQVPGMNSLLPGISGTGSHAENEAAGSPNGDPVSLAEGSPETQAADDAAEGPAVPGNTTDDSANPAVPGNTADDLANPGVFGDAASDSANPGVFGDAAPGASDGSLPDEELQTVSDSGPAAPTPTPVPLGEDGLPIVHYMEVDNTYFDDAVFIGDSRTRSLQLYAGFENTTFLADTGLTIYTVLDKKLTPSTENAKTTVADYLTEHQFKKIYLMLGINELGTGTAESFCKAYSEVLSVIEALQPDAIIYLQAILHISEEKDSEGTYINNDAIIERNEALRGLADNVRVFWLDANPAVCDENSYLIGDYTFDGVHLQAKYVPLWTDWLKLHAVQSKAAPQEPRTSADTASQEPRTSADTASQEPRTSADTASQEPRSSADTAPKP